MPAIAGAVGTVVGVIGLMIGLAGAAAYLTGESRKTIAEQRNEDIKSQGVTIGILKERVTALENELAEAKQTIANLTSNMQSGEAVQRLVEAMDRRLKEEGK